MTELTSYESLVLGEYLAGLSENEREEKKKNALDRLLGGEPIAYVVGYQYFYDLCFKVSKDTLIPRPDTERLVERAIELIPKGCRFADLGTGSGCIPITVLSKRHDLSADAIDISAGALETAKENASLCGVADRISFISADMLKGDKLRGKYAAIISNPPYIKTKALKEYPSLSFEPITALDGGEDGMLFYRAILKNYKDDLEKGGFFLFEIGYDQREDITALSEKEGFSCSVTKDYSGNDRVALLYKNE